MTFSGEMHLSQSSLGIQSLPNRKYHFKSPDSWLEDKKVLDRAEGLWRVHDNLYDFTSFVKMHPGGQFWLDVTKGTDITEAFESHHISTKPEAMLKTYFRRKASTPRSSPFTFHEDGFYRTLKRSVRETLKDLPNGVISTSKIMTDCLLFSAFFFAVLSCATWSYAFSAISGFFLASTAMAAHNYFHQKDNFRMYYSDIALMQSREWRIIHVLSHHLHTNSVMDMQVYLSESILQYFPHRKSKFVKYGSWIYAPALMWPVLFHFMFLVRMVCWLSKGQSKCISKADFLPLLLPLTMYTIAGQPLLPTLGMWCFLVCVHSFWFSFIGFTMSHFHPDVFMDGDKPRPKNQMDWGISQLDTVSDRYEVTGSHFLVLISFGDHAMHHLFPTFDHGLLQHLYPVVRRTMKEFNLDIRMTDMSDMVGGYFRQLAKEKPNMDCPNLTKNKR